MGRSRCRSGDAGNVLVQIHDHVAVLAFDWSSRRGLVGLFLSKVRNAAVNDSIANPGPEVVLAKHIQELSVGLQFAYLDKVILETRS
jgi:hypothetical protein